jgi:hypothetical protein
LFELKKFKYTESDTYPVSTEAEFGSAIKVMRSSDSLGRKAAWLLVRWQRELADGSQQLVSDDAVIAAINEKIPLHSKLVFAMDKQPAVWTLTVFDLQGIQLYQQQFKFDVMPK